MSQEWTIPLQIRISLGAPGQGAKLAAVPGMVNETVAGADIASVARPRRALPPSGGALESVDTFLDKFSIPSLTDASFNYRTALSLALASRLAYGDANRVEHTAKNIWGLQTCKFVEKEDTQCFVASAAGAVLVAFRGTSNLGDWLANLNTFGTNQSYGRVHRGFLGAFREVKAELEALLAQFPGRPVLLTGHSLGGALAVMASAEWQGKFPISWLHTHGQPAVGQKNFQIFMETHYGDKYYRFVNDDDLVPMVPPFFNHSGRLIHFGEGGGLESLVGSEELEAVGVDLGPLPVETPMLTPEQFDLLRARLLEERAVKSAPLDEGTVESAVVESTVTAAGGMENLESLEGLFPSISDHNMDLYVAKIAHQAGF